MPKQFRSTKWLKAGLFVIPVLAAILIISCAQQSKDALVKKMLMSPKEDQLSLFSLDPNMQAVFIPMPLRVSTVGAGLYHRPFCPYAQSQLKTYGPSKRTNYFTVQQIDASHKQPDPYCYADEFERPTDPTTFAQHGHELCRISRKLYQDCIVPQGEVLCSWTGYIGIVVPPNNCINGTLSTFENIPVTMGAITFNTIPSGIGDADNDADVTEDDFDFLVACYSGPGVTATPAASATFDYDQDGDVDIYDFKVWFSELHQGNSTYVAAHWPEATKGITLAYPLRRGMEGATKYHMPNCPNVMNSGRTYGFYKMIDFYTWDQVIASRRTPDTLGPPNFCDARKL